ncbi:hypothetical protein [Paenibacillus sp. J2TS4]|nr:hypothetical protein [Paenibacillus sp. J2TS4]
MNKLIQHPLLPDGDKGCFFHVVAKPVSDYGMLDRSWYNTYNFE